MRVNKWSFLVCKYTIVKTVGQKYPNIIAFLFQGKRIIILCFGKKPSLVAARSPYLLATLPAMATRVAHPPDMHCANHLFSTAH